MSKLKKAFRFLLLVIFLFVLHSIYVLPMLFQNGGGDCIVDERKDTYHTDYVWGYVSGVKWSHTVFCRIDPPTQLAGNQDYTILHKGKLYPKPIPLPGQWQFSYTVVPTKYWKVYLPYIAYTTRSMMHTRIGWRWDDLDDFFLFSIVPAKRLPYNWERIMLNRYICILARPEVLGRAFILST